jgi:hypothetical protein
MCYFRMEDDNIGQENTQEFYSKLPLTQNQIIKYVKLFLQFINYQTLF